MLKRLDTLRFQVAWILVLAIVPLALLAVYLAVDDGRKDATRAQVDARATVHLVSQDLTRLIQSSRDLVLGFGKNPILIRNGADACSAELAALKPSFPQFANMVVVGKDFTIVCAASNPTHLRAIPKRGDNLALFELVGREDRAALGGFLITATGRRTLPLVGPIHEPDGRVRSWFFVTLDLAWLDAQVRAIPVPSGASLLVMDREGLELARNPGSKDWQPGALAPTFERTLAGKQDFDQEVTGDDGIRRFYSAAKVGSGEGLVVVMKTRLDEIYRPARQRLILHLLGLAGVGVLVMGLGWLGGDRFFTRPLSSLIQAANQLAGGNPASRSGLPYEGEIGGLARSFDQMADALEKEQAKALRTSQTLRTIVEGTAASTGEAFFRSLARSLTVAMKADYALVGELTKDLQSVQTLAVCSDGEIVPNILYELRGNPSQGVMREDSSFDPAGIQELFPENAVLRETHMKSYLGVPLRDCEGRALGLIAVLYREPIPDVITDPRSLLTIFAARASVELTRLRAEQRLRHSIQERELAAARNEEMVETLQALTARLHSVREEERTRIAREIHDELGQQLTAMRFDLSSLRNRLAKAAAKGEAIDPLLSGFAELTGVVDSTIRDIRRIATELRPSVLDTFGLAAAIEWLAADFERRTQIRCHFKCAGKLAAGDPPIDRDLSTAIFRICQESLTNIVRHANASEAWIRVETRRNWLLLEISDNGRGISPENLIYSRSLGVAGMRERARIAGGELEIGNRAERGAMVQARFPVPALTDAVQSTLDDGDAQ